MQYLSDEWLSAAGEALAATELEQPVSEPLTVEYEVTGAPSGKVKYSLATDSDGLSLTPGKADKPTATMALDYDTAAAITKGDLSPQAAFMQGKLKLGGNVRILIDRAKDLETAGDAFAGLRETTEF